MDSAFLLNEEGRSNFLQFVLQSFGCTYICLWSYLPLPSHCLFFKDGIYNEHHHVSSSSYTPTVCRQLFDQYRNSVFMVQTTDTVPGLAFKNNTPYVQLRDLELTRLASIQLQSQFYQEARIKTAIFMGCKSGEIELGFSHDYTRMNIEIEIRNWLQRNIFQIEPALVPQTTTNDQSHGLSSSSSSLISMDSPEYSPRLFNMPSTPSSNYIMHPIDHSKETSLTLRGQLQAEKQVITRAQNILFPSLDSDVDAAMTRAMVAVVSSSASPLQNRPSAVPFHFKFDKKSSAFKSYNESSLPPLQNIGLGSQSTFKRAIMYLRRLGTRRIQVTNMQVNLPTSTQLHHMISERKRREKLNDSFQSLRSLIPPGSKRDKASVLANTRDYLATLKAQVSDLTHKNELLGAQLSSINIQHNSDTKLETEEDEGSSSLNGRIKVRVANVSESTSTERMVNVTVRVLNVGNGSPSKMDIAIKLLEFLKTIENASLVSMSTITQAAESSHSSDLIRVKLKLEGALDKYTLEQALLEHLLTWYNGQFADEEQ